jgi:SAM-dependent methyltransferase
MKDDHDPTVSAAAIAKRVGEFYERHPYPPPIDDLERYRKAWDEPRRQADSHLFWPNHAYRDDRTILIAGCGASQAARYAVRWPNAKVIGIDVSATSIRFTNKLKRKHDLANLEVRQLSIERVGELGRRFDHVVCTGVLHHLPDPHAGLQALAEALAPNGALHLMIYAPYGRAGVYLLQDYCRRIGVRPTAKDIAELVASLRELPGDHPLVPLLRASPDFGQAEGIADALLHPQDRPFSVPELFELLRSAGLRFGRWVRQAAYLPQCGGLANTPHRQRLSQLPAEEQYAAVELFRGTMVRHSLSAYRADQPSNGLAVTFDGEAWLNYVPIRMSSTIAATREQAPAGETAVLINREHAFNDLYLSIDARQEAAVAAVDGARTIEQIIAGVLDRDAARAFFRRLWDYDQVVFDTSRS